MATRLVSALILATATIFPGVGGAAETTTGTAETTSGRNFSFLHLSDIHVDTWTTMPEDLSEARSYASVKTLKELGENRLAPYDVTAPKPQFIIATGDNTEFGFAGETGDVLERYFEGVDAPQYYATGNHDNTWVPPTKWFAKRHGGQNYSWDHDGAHFIALNSASLQDPNPSFGEEVIRFLKEDLRKQDNQTPIFIFFHHPLDSREFASRYDVDRVLDAVRAYNVVLFLVGHGHSAVTYDFAGIPGVMGGSTFSKPTGKNNNGYNVVYVKGNSLKIAYRYVDDSEATKPMLNLTIPKRASYPGIVIQPVEVPRGDGDVKISASINGTKAPLKKAGWSLDDETTGELKISGATVEASIPKSRLDNGMHFVRLTFEDQKGNKYQRSTSFRAENGDPDTTMTALWKFAMGGGTRSTPLVKDGRVFVGSNDGLLYAVDAKSGKLVWKKELDGEVGTSPAAHEDTIFAGSGGGKFYALSASDGTIQWEHDAGLPIFGSPVVDTTNSLVIFGSNNGDLTALDLASGKVKWENEEPEYSIETRPLLANGRLYVGAWDGYVYAIESATGKTIWKKPSTYNQKRVVRYYAAADSTPVLADGKLYVADRGYYGGRYDAETGSFEEMLADDVTAFAPSADKKALYLRNTKSGLAKIDLTSSSLWISDVVAGRIPAAPVEHGDYVIIVTNTGKLVALDAATGKAVADYRVTPQLFVMTAPAVEENVLYTAGLDGVLTAVRLPTRTP